MFVLQIKKNFLKYIFILQKKFLDHEKYICQNFAVNSIIWSLKLVSAIFHQFFIFSPNDSPSKTERCFLFHLKSSFPQDIQIFVFFPRPFHFFQIQKEKWKWNN